jgi:hypothetical protein
MPIRCPKCGHQQQRGNECEACGVIFSKASANAGVVRRETPRASSSEWNVASPLDAFLTGTDSLMIDQHAKSWIEIFLDWEQRNEYAINDSVGRGRGWVVEQGQGFAAAMKRSFLGSHRPLHLIVFGAAGSDRDVILELKRPFYWLFSNMEVVTPDGRKLGSVLRRWSFMRRTFDLADATGRVFGRIVTPIFSIWKFPLFDPAGTQIAEISKNWAGLTQEWITDADKFTIRFMSQRLTTEERAVIFAAALTIDYDFFENNTKRSR